jgi:2-polyprenyl-3-methyl-5-hydroxy-6-metoxy-1,4-benzoquinol methylase
MELAEQRRSAPTQQIMPSAEGLASACQDLALRKYGSQPSHYMAARRKVGYVSPEDQYEALIERYVTPQTRWLDVGCGRAPFPNNQDLSEELSLRALRMIGVDPDSGVRENPFVHQGHQCSLEDFTANEKFDLVTARMVVEHVEQPARFAQSLARLTNPGSVVVLFTVNWWSITALAAHWSPLGAHHMVKRWLWGTEEKDTFPTTYKMNQRATLSRLMIREGFRESLFQIAADASLLWRVPVARRLELQIWRAFTSMRLPYPDSCILAAYERIS